MLLCVQPEKIIEWIDRKFGLNRVYRIFIDFMRFKHAVQEVAIHAK